VKTVLTGAQGSNTIKTLDHHLKNVDVTAIEVIDLEEETYLVGTSEEGLMIYNAALGEKKMIIPAGVCIESIRPISKRVKIVRTLKQILAVVLSQDGTNAEVHVIQD